MNIASIYKHVGGFGVELKGIAYKKMGLQYVDHFIDVADAYVFARNVKDETGCQVIWEIERPTWAFENEEDTK